MAFPPLVGSLALLVLKDVEDREGAVHHDAGRKDGHGWNDEDRKDGHVMRMAGGRLAPPVCPCRGGYIQGAILGRRPRIYKRRERTNFRPSYRRW